MFDVKSMLPERGKIVRNCVKVAEHNDGSEISIPIIALRGHKDGPVLWLQNGTHGVDYLGIGVIHSLIETIDPSGLRGTIVALPMLNIMAYRNSMRNSPQDRVDMDRAFPGNRLEKAMHIFAHTEIIAMECLSGALNAADYYIDLHAGDLESQWAPYAQYLVGPELETTAVSRRMAQVSGLNIIFEVDAEDRKYDATGTFALEANRGGIPGVRMGLGGQGTISVEWVSTLRAGIERILGSLGLTEETKQDRVSQIVIRETTSIRSNTGGLLWRLVNVLDQLKEGEISHRVVSLDGQLREEISAPSQGTVLAIRTAGTVYKGDQCLLLGLGENVE